MTLVKTVRQTLFRGAIDIGCEDHCSGALSLGREVGLNSEYKNKWEFIAKEQDGHLLMENYSRGNLMGIGKF